MSIGLLLAALHGKAPAVAAQDPPPVPEAARVALLALEKTWDDAISSKDLPVLERILAPGFVFIDADGSITSRTALLQGIKSPTLIVDPFTTRDVQVRVYDNTAILTGWFEQAGSYDGQRFHIRQRYTDVYVKQGSRWIAVSAHASSLGPSDG